VTVECLTASLNGAGDLVLKGQDLGPSTPVVSPHGEYEWITLAGQRRWTGIEPAWPRCSATSVLKTVPGVFARRRLVSVRPSTCGNTVPPCRSVRPEVPLAGAFVSGM